MLIVEDLNNKTRRWLPNRIPGAHKQFPPGLIIMKFGEQLRTSVIKEYEYRYIDYDGLKELLKTAIVPAPPTLATKKAKVQREKWNEEHEEIFVNRLDGELEKVHEAVIVKATEIARRIKSSDKEVKDIVSRLENLGPVVAEQEEDRPTEEEFMMLEEDLSDIIADVHDLAKFVQLNYTGFQKIIKKHDVSC
jgi:SPX domain protein involved in polyphosphate accumulation